MSKLKVMKRDPKSKANLLRRDGFVPGCIFGKDYNPSLLIQLTDKEVELFLRSNSIGSRVDIDYDGKTIPTILKEYSRRYSANKIEHLSFQALIAGEKVLTAARVELINAEKVTSGDIIQVLYDVKFRTTSEHLFDHVEVDMDGMKIGDHITVEDIPEFNHDFIELEVEPNSVVVEVKEHIVAPEPEEETAEDTTEDTTATSEEK